ncbi:hypothetical protein ARMGADRAFT_1038424 [Armillaria gallica]|uniref:Uncharacterized protein n=1 Tax=Armillaria gallica TaxID=47427 RepID=A0A2H3CHT1_ARMGA|nr:hypothetical protein ARMGADRAFT_1038424 [Armillaria gallica]
MHCLLDDLGGSSFGLSFGLATLLPSSLPLNDAGVDSVNQEAVAQPSNSDDDEEEEGIQNPLQVQGTTDGEVFEDVGANDEAPAPSAPAPSDLAASPPPYVRQAPEISFVFDDISGDWEPYPTVFLPRPQHLAPTEQGLHCSA